MLDVEVGQGDCGSSRTVALGEDVAVALPENPTTGYRWQVSADHSFLQLTGDGFEAVTDLRGASGIRLLTFRTVRPGRVRLTLERRREWESPGIPAAGEFWLDLTIA